MFKRKNPENSKHKYSYESVRKKEVDRLGKVTVSMVRVQNQ